MRTLPGNDYNLNLASSVKRVMNFIIDTFIVSICYSFAITSQIFEKSSNSSIELIIFFIFYYFAFEMTFGKTPAKFITRTRVIKQDGTMPGFMDIVVRSLCRLIPFEVFSFLNSRALGWHDTISKTRVIDEAKNVTIQEEIATNESEE